MKNIAIYDTFFASCPRVQSCVTLLKTIIYKYTLSENIKANRYKSQEFKIVNKVRVRSSRIELYS